MRKSLLAASLFWSLPVLGQNVDTKCGWTPPAPLTVKELNAPYRDDKPEWQKQSNNDYFVVSRKGRLYFHSLPDSTCRSELFIVQGDVVSAVDFFPKRDGAVDGNKFVRVAYWSKQLKRDVVGWVELDGVCRMLASGESVCGVKPRK